MSPFLAWDDFHARSRFAFSTIPEEKWGTTRSLAGLFSVDTPKLTRPFFGRPRDHAAIQSGSGRRGDGSQEKQKRSFPSTPHPPSPRPLPKKEKTQNRTKKTSQEPICSRWEMLPAGERGEERENPSHPSMRCIALRTR